RRTVLVRAHIEPEPHEPLLAIDVVPGYVDRAGADVACADHAAARVNGCLRPVQVEVEQVLRSGYCLERGGLADVGLAGATIVVAGNRAARELSAPEVDDVAAHSVRVDVVVLHVAVAGA